MTKINFVVLARQEHYGKRKIHNREVIEVQQQNGSSERRNMKSDCELRSERSKRVEGKTDITTAYSIIINRNPAIMMMSSQLRINRV